MHASEILIDVIEASALLRMPRARLARLARAGKVPAVILPDAEVRFRRADLVQWVSRYHQPGDEVSK